MFPKQQKNIQKNNNNHHIITTRALWLFQPPWPLVKPPVPTIFNGEKWLGFVGGDLRNRWFSAHGSHGSHRSSDFLGMCGGGFSSSRWGGRRGLPGESKIWCWRTGGFLIFEVFFVFLDLFCMSFFDVPFLGRGSSYNRYNLDHPYDKEMICLKKRSKPHDGWVVLMKELWVISEFQEISIPSDVQNLPDWQMVFYMDQKYVGILREISTPWE